MKVRVGGVDFKVLVAPIDADLDSLGHTKIHEKTITIDASLVGQDKDRVLFHEMIHAALGVSGWDAYLKEDKDEGIVTALEMLLFPIFGRPFDEVVKK